MKEELNTGQSRMIDNDQGFVRISVYNIDSFQICFILYILMLTTLMCAKVFTGLQC